jgi:hypothetical protein
MPEGQTPAETTEIVAGEGRQLKRPHFAIQI